MSKVPPPVLGFNNNVRHRGRIFHIQTEDSGVRFPRIVTHLFADGGRIIKTTKTDYSEHVSRQDLASVVRAMMKDQHKAMFVSLRAGEFDPLLERAIGPLPEAPVPRPSGIAPASAPVTPTEPRVSTTQLPMASELPAAAAVGAPDPESPKRGRTLSNPNLQRVTPSVAPPSPDALDRAVASLDDVPPSRPVPPPPPSRGRKSNPAGGRKRNSAAPARAVIPQAIPQRPSAQFAAAPPPSARSIFGDGVGEKSLDEVILSYLAEDLDGSGE